MVTINAYHILYGQEFRAYSLVFLLATLSTFLLIKAVENDIENPATGETAKSSVKSPPSNSSRKSFFYDSSQNWWRWYVIVSVAAVYSHYYMVFILIAQAVSLLVLFYGSTHISSIKSNVIDNGIAIIILIVPLAIAIFLAKAVGLAWVLKPSIGRVMEFAVEMAGKQGNLLLALYLFAIGIGLLVGIRAWFQRDAIRKWKFALLASCLFLPVFMSLLVSELMMPIFVDRYLLFIMPYMAVLAAVGIVALVKMGWSNWRIGIATVPIGILLFVLIIWQSAKGINTYFEQFKKEDWRGASQFLSEECQGSLRLYQRYYMEPNVVYYNANLKSQIRNWSTILNTNPNSEEIASLLPASYTQVCLVLSHIGTPQDIAQTKNIQAALWTKFPHVTKVNKFYSISVEIYK